MDLAKLRYETPGTKHRIHLNNAGASLMPSPVIKAIEDHIQLEAHMGGYEAAKEKKNEINDFYHVAAKLIHCHRRNIAYTTNATDSYARAISSIPFEKDDVILTSQDDYVSNYIAMLSLVKRFGVHVVTVPNSPSGGIDITAAESLIVKHKPVLFSLTHIPTSSGLIQPVSKIGELCRQYGVLYLVDGCQSIGQLSVDVNSCRCDFMSFTARKFLRGPRGAGFLFVSDRVLDLGLYPLFLDMEGADWIAADQFKLKPTAKRFEDWEFAYALMLGTKCAIDYALSVGMDQIENRTRDLSLYTRESLSTVSHIHMHDTGNDLGAIITITSEKMDVAHLYQFLYKSGINTSITDKSSALLDFSEKGLEKVLRISPHYYNTESEVDRFIEILKGI